jgi:hypothetical protein
VRKVKQRIRVERADAVKVRKRRDGLERFLKTAFLAASNYIPAWRRLAGAFTPNSEGLSVRVLPAGAKAERCMKTSGKRHGMKEKFDDLSGAGYVYWRENSWRIEGKL